MNIYGKDNAVNVVSSMIKNNRLAHSFLIYGNKGVGKKFLARYIAKLIMCRNKNSDNPIPCGKCRSCMNIDKNVHADIIFAEHSGKLGGFSVETAREVCREALVYPNDSDAKIYMFEDADAISISVQNILLKTIEEPPEFTYFIFTASSKDIFLDTVISRVISLGVSECSNTECISALAEYGFTAEEVSPAVEAFGGNIGNCLAYMNDEIFRHTAELTKILAECIINNDEYGFLAALADADKNIFRQIISMLDTIVRNSMVIKYDDNLTTGCYPAECQRLSGMMSTERGCKIHALFNEALELVKSNVNIKLVCASLCRNIFDC